MKKTLNQSIREQMLSGLGDQPMPPMMAEFLEVLEKIPQQQMDKLKDLKPGEVGIINYGDGEKDSK